MSKAFIEYIPATAKEEVLKLVAEDHIIIKVKGERKTRHGDYRKLPNGKHQITVNNSLNQYRFLITLIHEIAHYKTYEIYGNHIKPHGKEWKQTFQHLMLPYLRPEVFPEELLPLLANHFKNPKASSNTDTDLVYALKQFDPPNNKTYVFELPHDSKFKLYNGRVFRKGKQRRKRFECLEVNTGKLYLFNPNAEVEIVN